MSSPAATLRAPLLWLVLPFMAGIAVAGRGDPGWTASGWVPAVAASSVLAGLAFSVRPGRLAALATHAFLVLAAGLAGITALSQGTRLPPAWATTPREAAVIVEVETVFASAPTRKTLSGLGRIVAAEAHLRDLAGQRVYFSVIRKVSLPPVAGAQYAMRGVVQQRPPAREGRGFDAYLESAGIRLDLVRGQIERELTPPGRFRRFCVRSQDQLEGLLRRGLENQPGTASLYLAMLLGERAALSAEQQNAFMRSGTFHIFSISGLHVMVIAGAIQTLLSLLRLPRRPAVATSLTVLWLYVQVTGGGTPAERAFLMIAFLRGAQWFRLPHNHLAALSAAALTALVLNPRDLFSAGFQLSYGVVAALIVMASPLAARWREAWRPWRDLPETSLGRGHRLARWLTDRLTDGLAATWAALLASTPATIACFGLFTPGALAANLVIVPLSTGAIWSGFVSLLAGLAGADWIGTACNFVAALFIRTMDGLVQAGAEWPGVYFRAAFSSGEAAAGAQIAVLAAMLAGASLGWRGRAASFWLPAAVLAVALILGVKFG